MSGAGGGETQSQLSLKNGQMIFGLPDEGVDVRELEAAAFMEIAWAGAALPQGRAEMILDRPFLYAIRHRGQVIFVGICGNPE